MKKLISASLWAIRKGQKPELIKTWLRGEKMLDALEIAKTAMRGEPGLRVYQKMGKTGLIRKGEVFWEFTLNGMVLLKKAITPIQLT